MPAKEIKELRQAGKLDEAYAMAIAELEADLSNIWSKRNLSWVLYAQLDKLAPNMEAFILKLNEVKELDLPLSEEMFFENISIVVSKAVRFITGEVKLDVVKLFQLFDAIKELPFKRNTKWYSILFSSLHKGMKETYRYIEFADWWDFKNFRPEDFQKEKMSNGREVMAIAEQAYIAYAKHLLPLQTMQGETVFDKEKVLDFLPILTNVVDSYPEFQYPAYFKAKLLLALGDKENTLDLLLPFARKKRNDFWVWEILADAFNNDQEKVFACYCKALSCKSPQEMLVSLRQKMARLLISKALYNEARTEIELLVQIRAEHGYKIPFEVVNWTSMNWFKIAYPFKSNFSLYMNYVNVADALLFHDILEEIVVVEYVNQDKKILNFIASESKFGFLKYERFLKEVKVGDILKVRFQSGDNNSIHHVYTLDLDKRIESKGKFIKSVTGKVIIPEGKTFGFISNIFIPPVIVNKYKLQNNMEIIGEAVMYYNKDASKIDWKLFEIKEIV